MLLTELVMSRMQLELEIFRQLQMKRKEAPRPSDSSDNSAGSGAVSAAGPTSSSSSGPLSSSTVGPASSSVGAPSSSPSSNPGSDLSTCAKLPTNLCSEPALNVCRSDPPQSVVAQSVGTQPTVNENIGLLPCPKTCSEAVSAISHTDPVHMIGSSAGQLTASHSPQYSQLDSCILRGSRPTRQLAKQLRPQTFSSVSTPVTVSHGISQSADTASTPVTLSHSVSTPVTPPYSVSQSADTAAAAAAGLSKPARLLQDIDNLTDIQLETLTDNNSVSTLDTDLSGENVTQL